MKRRYIFLIYRAGGWGGVQFYIKAKSCWLAGLGYEVEVMYSEEENGGFLDGIESLRCRHVKWLGRSPRSFSSRLLCSVLSQMAGEHAGDYMETTVESASLPLGLWGEMLARECGGRHILYMQSEKYVTPTRSMRKFLQHKYDQRLLYGISGDMMAAILPGIDGDRTYLYATGNADVEPVSYAGDTYSFHNLPKADLTLLTIGRFEKGITRAVIRGAAEYCRAGAGRRINILILGDAADAVLRDRVLGYGAGCRGLHVEHVGFVNPMPLDAFLKADLCICNSGCAVVASRHLPVVTVDARDLKAIGILEEETMSLIHRLPEEPPVEISRIIERMVAEKEEVRKRRQSNPATGTLWRRRMKEKGDFSAHAAILAQTPLRQDYYYPVENVWRCPLRECVWILARMAGGEPLVEMIKRFAGRCRIIAGEFALKHSIKQGHAL